VNCTVDVVIPPLSLSSVPQRVGAVSLVCCVPVYRSVLSHPLQRKPRAVSCVLST